MALFVSLKVVANASKQRCILDQSHSLKCYVLAPAIDGKANKAVIAYIAKKLGVPASKIEIISGLTSKYKRLAIDTHLSLEQVLNLLDCPTQTKLI